jgi:FK506-binding nuclear protein
LHSGPSKGESIHSPLLYFYTNSPFFLQNYQQPIDITIGENERVFFKVSGTHTIYLTGNYVEPAHDHEHGPGGNGMYDPDSDDEDDYDLEPNSDEEIDYDSEDDELDDMEDPRITEVEDEEEAPKLIKAEKKGKNKRPAEEDAAASIDELIAKAEEKPLSKKQLKKLKKNDGSATETKTEEPVSASKSDKKVSFAKQLEQGPTPTKADANKAAPESKKSAVAGAASSGPRVVQGVTIDDKKLGSGPAAKAGDKVGMRYIGKLEKDGKVFDSNKKGKPFSFKLVSLSSLSPSVRFANYRTGRR